MKYKKPQNPKPLSSIKGQPARPVKKVKPRRQTAARVTRG